MGRGKKQVNEGFSGTSHALTPCAALEHSEDRLMRGGGGGGGGRTSERTTNERARTKRTRTRQTKEDDELRCISWQRAEPDQALCRLMLMLMLMM